jgi:hypothetical protein
MLLHVFYVEGRVCQAVVVIVLEERGSLRLGLGVCRIGHFFELV